MTERLMDFLLQRDPRERALLALLVFLVIPLAILLGVLLPLREERAAAERALLDAAELQTWVSARADEMSRLAAPAAGAARSRPIGSSGIEASLIEAGLRPFLSGLNVRPGGRVELQFDEVTFVMLANWLSAMAPGWGYEIADFRFEALETPAKITARLTLVPPG